MTSPPPWSLYALIRWLGKAVVGKRVCSVRQRKPCAARNRGGSWAVPRIKKVQRDPPAPRKNYRGQIAWAFQSVRSQGSFNVRPAPIDTTHSLKPLKPPRSQLAVALCIPNIWFGWVDSQGWARLPRGSSSATLPRPLVCPS